MSRKVKMIIVVLLPIFIVGSGYTAYRFYDYTQNDPKFCVSCHLMFPAYDAWAFSAHRMLNCHECHKLTMWEQNMLLINFVLHRPTEVPERHGEIIVPWDFCIKCHWELDKHYPSAQIITKSRMHAKHFFMEQIECSQCHGYITHKFVPEARFCVKCHKGKVVHGSGMEELSCLNCHAEEASDLMPGRSNCLLCHGDESLRQMIAKGEIPDFTRYQPSEEIIRKAIKISVPEAAPMQFDCVICHEPHQEVRPDWGKCLDCHRNILKIGQHAVHVQDVGMECRQCHRPHGWSVTDKSAKEDCTMCHEYRAPNLFLRG